MSPAPHYRDHFRDRRDMWADQFEKKGKPAKARPEKPTPYIKALEAEVERRIKAGLMDDCFCGRLKKERVSWCDACTDVEDRSTGNNTRKKAKRD